jgi:hypothetical protein
VKGVSHLDGPTPNHLALNQKGLTSASGLPHAGHRPAFDKLCVTPRDGNSTWSWPGRPAGAQPAGFGWLSLRIARAQDRPIPAPTGPRHDDARRQGAVSDDGRFCRVRAGDDCGTSPCRGAPPRLPPRSKNESARPWRLLGGPVCASLPNSSESIPRQCSASAALSPPQASPSDNIGGAKCEGEAERLVFPRPNCLFGCPLSGVSREAHRKDRTLARLARHGHVAAHHARELAGDGKAETGAAIAACGQGVSGARC